MRRIEEYYTTGNRYVYNRHRKIYLEDREIFCSWCKYNREENSTWKYYGQTNFRSTAKDPEIRYPSWKLVSKNRKQWMNKTSYEIKEKTRLDYRSKEYTTIEINFKRNMRK